MGYVATDNGFYSSGHPHPSAGLINPFGLIKSSDGGHTLTKLGFEGESDFHLMGVGYWLSILPSVSKIIQSIIHLQVT